MRATGHSLTGRLAVLALGHATAQAAAGRERLSLDRDCLFQRGDVPMPAVKGHGMRYHNGKTNGAWGASAADFDDSAWRRLDLPHDWAAENPFDRNENASHGCRARRVALQSDAIAVRVDADAQEGWWYEGADISRHTRLVRRDTLHIATDGLHADPVERYGRWSVPVAALESAEAQGRPAPTANVHVHFEIDVPSPIRGVGNGESDSREPDTASEHRLYSGLAQVIVQARREGRGAWTRPDPDVELGEKAGAAGQPTGVWGRVVVEPGTR